MVRSRQLRVDNEFAKTVERMRNEMRKVYGKKITNVQITRVIGKNLNNVNMMGSVVVVKRRGKRVDME